MKCKSAFQSHREKKKPLSKGWKRRWKNIAQSSNPFVFQFPNHSLVLANINGFSNYCCSVFFLHSQFDHIIFEFFLPQYSPGLIILMSNLSLAHLPPHFSILFLPPLCAAASGISCLAWFLITFQVNRNNNIAQTDTHTRKYFWFSYYNFAFQTHGYRFKIDGHINKKAPFSILSSLSIGFNVDTIAIWRREK